MATRAQQGTALESEIGRIGRVLAGGFPSAARHPLKALDAKAMEATSSDEELRAALFRLVDVTPACRSLDDLASHLVGFLEQMPERPAALERAMKAASTRPGRVALGGAVTAGVRHMAHRFIVAEHSRAARRQLEGLWKAGVACSLDLLGEATMTAPEADRYAERCLEALEEVSAASESWPAQPLLEQDSRGRLPRANLSAKVSALTPLLRPEAPELGRDDAARRLRPLLRRAHELGAHLHVDMESVDTLEATLDLVLELLGEEEFREGPSAGIVLQAYLRESPQHFERVVEWARAGDREQPLTVRLVKGAYWDHEVIEAHSHGWAAPVFEDKAECDRNFEALTRRLCDERPLLRVAIASHNLRSVAHAIAYSRSLGAPDSELELQVLRGLGDDLAASLASQGLRVRSYCPVGDMVAGMAYLVRRLLENTANESFLGDLSRGADLDDLLRAP